MIRRRFQQLAERLHHERWRRVGIFLLNVVLGGVWARFAYYAANQDALMAALYDMFIVGIAATNALSYVKMGAKAAPFVIAGSVVGTYLAIRFL